MIMVQPNLTPVCGKVTQKADDRRPTTDDPTTRRPEYFEYFKIWKFNPIMFQKNFYAIPHKHTRAASDFEGCT